MQESSNDISLRDTSRTCETSALEDSLGQMSEPDVVKSVGDVVACDQQQEQNCSEEPVKVASEADAAGDGANGIKSMGAGCGKRDDEDEEQEQEDKQPGGIVVDSLDDLHSIGSKSDISIHDCIDATCENPPKLMMKHEVDTDSDADGDVDQRHPAGDPHSVGGSDSDGEETEGVATAVAHVGREGGGGSPLDDDGTSDAGADADADADTDTDSEDEDEHEGDRQFDDDDRSSPLRQAACRASVDSDSDIEEIPLVPSCDVLPPHDRRGADSSDDARMENKVGATGSDGDHSPCSSIDKRKGNSNVVDSVDAFAESSAAQDTLEAEPGSPDDLKLTAFVGQSPAQQDDTGSGHERPTNSKEGDASSPGDVPTNSTSIVIDQRGGDDASLGGCPAKLSPERSQLQGEEDDQNEKAEAGCDLADESDETHSWKAVDLGTSSPHDASGKADDGGKAESALPLQDAEPESMMDLGVLAESTTAGAQALQASKNDLTAANHSREAEEELGDSDVQGIAIGHQKVAVQGEDSNKGNDCDNSSSSSKGSLEVEPKLHSTLFEESTFMPSEASLPHSSEEPGSTLSWQSQRKISELQEALRTTDERLRTLEAREERWSLLALKSQKQAETLQEQWSAMTSNMERRMDELQDRYKKDIEDLQESLKSMSEQLRLREDSEARERPQRSSEVVDRLAEQVWAAPKLNGTEPSDRPLTLAAQCGHLDVIKLLATMDGFETNVVDKDDCTAIHQAANNGHLDVVKYLAEELGANVSLRDNQHNTPLHQAVSSGHLEVVEYLVSQAPSDLNAKGRMSRTPLHCAVLARQTQIFKLLASEGADLRAEDLRHFTPWTMAIEQGLQEIVEFMVSSDDWDINIRDTTSYGQAGLHTAAQHGHLDVIKFLLSKGARLNARDSHKLTPLMVAAAAGRFEVVQYLASLPECNLTQRCTKGRNARGWAKENGHQEIAAFLKTKGLKGNGVFQRGLSTLR